MAVANRAMRPIAALTATAGDIAATRDPSRRVPQPASDDEVAELARTFDQMLRELDAARTETEGTIKRQREFVADASHELRTPLTSILANLELLDHSLASDDEDERAAINSALRSSKRMNRLVGDLLLLARADAGRATMRREVDLAAIADEALEEVGAGRRRPSTSPRGSRDPLRSRATPTSCTGWSSTCSRTRSATRRAGRTCDCASRRSDDRVRLVVADDGPGIPEGMEDEVFGRFVRGEGPADRAAANGTGTGLGLSIVRAVTEAHHGTVLADRSKRGGARFTVSLPLAGDPADLKFERTLLFA